MYFPVQPGSYVPLIFISGFAGFLYSEMYSTVLTQLATHGYIVIGIDLDYPAIDISQRDAPHLTDEAQKIDSAVKWVSKSNGKDTFFCLRLKTFWRNYSLSVVTIVVPLIFLNLRHGGRST